MKRITLGVILVLAAAVMAGSGCSEAIPSEDVQKTESVSSVSAEEETKVESVDTAAEEVLKIESGNAEFDEFINNTIELLPEEEIEFTEWVEEGECFRVALQLTEEPEDRYRHNRDYVFVKKDDAVKYIVVDYMSDYTDVRSVERYVDAACDFRTVYEDVSFDGNKDIVIFLGHFGPRGIERSCAYIYTDGEFVYTKSFEDIPYYSVDNKEERIYGWYYDGMLANDVISKYKFENGEYILEAEEEFTEEKYGDFCFYSSMDKWEVRKKIKNRGVEYNGKKIGLSELLTGDSILYAEADVAGNSFNEDAFIQDGTLYLVDWDKEKVIYEGTAYESLLERHMKKGILYKRDGGAPKHTDYKYIVFDEDDANRVVCTWSCYDADENDIYDQNDLYFFNDEEMQYEEWERVTAEYMELEQWRRAWIEISLK
ncbi:MAG: hypothetical protein K6G72_02740 [Lachnospiraceae bacterium]|nr:hypothetical protein [Lachnospiraceae bacterium]